MNGEIGYCPICGLPGVMRERRPNGNDRCAMGHIYPSATAKPDPVSERIDESQPSGPMLLKDHFGIEYSIPDLMKEEFAGFVQWQKLYSDTTAWHGSDFKKYLT